MYVLLSGPFTIAASLPRLSSTPRTETSLTAIADAPSIFVALFMLFDTPMSDRNGSRRPPGSYEYASEAVASGFAGSLPGATLFASLTSLPATGGATAAGAGGAVFAGAGVDAFVCAFNSAVAN